jgi:hypothetical protein
VRTADDCDDDDPDSLTRAQDGDCDGALAADDCNDADPNSLTRGQDRDCDGALAADDCDDADPNSLTRAQDGDCDGVVECSAGQTLIEISGADLPLVIPDRGEGYSDATVFAAGTVGRVIAWLDSIEHGSVGDLWNSLIAPNGTSVLLSGNNGGSGDNYTDTVFNDVCGGVYGSINNGTAPFTGCFSPATPLAGQQAAGAWTLEVSDPGLQALGTLVAWHIGLGLQ